MSGDGRYVAFSSLAHGLVPDDINMVRDAQHGEVIASAMISHDGHRGSVYYLAVSPAHQGMGHGAVLMQRAEELLRDAGCPKINLLVRHDNVDVIDFYRNRGYSRDAVACLGKRLIADD